MVERVFHDVNDEIILIYINKLNIIIKENSFSERKRKFDDGKMRKAEKLKVD